MRHSVAVSAGGGDAALLGDFRLVAFATTFLIAGAFFAAAGLLFGAAGAGLAGAAFLPSRTGAALRVPSSSLPPWSYPGRSFLAPQAARLDLIANPGERYGSNGCAVGAGQGRAQHGSAKGDAPVWRARGKP